MENILKFKIGELLDKPVGTSLRYSIEGEVELEDLKFNSDLSAKVELMKIDKGVNVSAKDVKVIVELNCDKCLKEYDYEINAPFMERQFYFKKNKNDDIRDIYLVDMKKTEIDISEMLRQEINLHFPVVSVCSLQCKGLCPICGVDRNVEKCNCEEENAVVVKQNPFSKLKDLLK